MSEKEDKAVETICVPIDYLHKLEKKNEEYDGEKAGATTGDSDTSE